MSLAFGVVAARGVEIALVEKLESSQQDKPEEQPHQRKRRYSYRKPELHFNYPHKPRRERAQPESHKNFYPRSRCAEPLGNYVV